MPSVTHRSIVSAPGYTDGAVSKARYNGVELFTLRPWTESFEALFPNVGMKGDPNEVLQFGKSLLVWADYRLNLTAPKAPGPFRVEANDPLFAADGAVHQTLGNYGIFLHETLKHSTEVLLGTDIAQTILR